MFLAVRYVMRKRQEKDARAASEQEEAQSRGPLEETVVQSPTIEEDSKATFNPAKRKSFNPCSHMPNSKTTVIETVTSEKIEPPDPDAEPGHNRSGLTRKDTRPIVSIEAFGIKPCKKCREEKLAARNYRIKLIIGLFFPFAIQALDTTIIANALPWIASDFNETSQMHWIISAFKSLLCCIYPLLGSNVKCRAIQGISVAGINVVVRTVLGDEVSLKEYAKNSSLFSIVAGVGYAVGPVIGGYLTDNDWRWCFGINLPVIVVGIVLVFLVLRKIVLGPQPTPQVTEKYGGNPRRMQLFKAKVSTIDIGGQFLFLSGMGLLILALTWGGTDYAWHSSIIGAIGITVLTWALRQGHTATIYGMMTFTGGGTGLRFMPGSLHGIAFFPNNIASIISMIAFAIPFGSTMAMTLMNVVFNNKAALPSSITASSSTSTISFGTIDSLPPDEGHKIRDRERDGVVWAFVSMLPFMWLCILAAGLLGNVRVTREYREDEEGVRDFSGNMVESVYLWSLLRGWRKNKAIRRRGRA
ncbi:hypothetical protein EYC80_005187 [Monilinia laxa]|uniref:Major facilitator superfamily (MFS) profile domain-containing protein n=1 Tax=Monilinia laxa TaxID=61186 RepID=A0A5N6KJ41_MONLA|nr:hypothetical protein EYC80_005187 [Monilinia laxa]